MNDFETRVLRSVLEAKEKIENIRAENRLVFPLFTDLHTIDVDHAYAQKLLFALERITETIRCDAIVDMGDNFDMLGRELHVTNEELTARFERLFSAVYRTASFPVIHVNGNHDAVGTDFFKPDFWNRIVRGKYGNTAAVYGDEGSYYYVDCERANVRLVVLSLPYESDIEAEMPTPLWAFGSHQLNWLRETALKTDKDVLLLSHVPFYYHYTGDKEATLAVWNGKEEKTAYVSALCGAIDDRDEAVAILDEFHQNRGRLVACLSGHMHYDLLLPPRAENEGRANPLPCHQVVTTATCIAAQAESAIGISIDVVVWDPSANELELIRIGDGEDRKIRL